MATKTLYCYNCDEAFKVSWENTKAMPEFCPFCAEIIDEEESLIDEEEFE
jgi:hypothetical protein